MLDDLNKLRQTEDFDFESEDEEIIPDIEEQGSASLFLGMTPVERMFISIFLFMNVTVLGLALLLATNRLSL